MKHKMSGSRWQSIVFIFILLLFLFRIFHSWLGTKLISSGDLHYFHNSYLVERVIWPQIWQEGNILPSLYAYPVGFATGLLAWAGLPFLLIERIVWLFPFVIFSFFGAFRLSKRRLTPTWSYLAGLFYTVNSYSLMILGGGQMGVALGYAIVPYVLHAYISLYEHASIRQIVFSALIFGLQIIFDLRIAYVTFLGMGIYVLIHLFTTPLKQGIKIIPSFIASILLTSLFHAFWILPYLVFPGSAVSGLGEEYTSVGALSFFSFADFSHTLAWLHPNWPENIFGKTYFLKPEFLVLPILAFSSLLFVRNKSYKNYNSYNHYIPYFCLLVLLGAFLAKGVNPPFGGIYRFFFERVPGFVMFRDPTKFYTLISISYSILIPFALLKIEQFIANKFRRIAFFLPFVAISFWVVLLMPAFAGKLNGTFQQTQLPEEYQKLTKMLASTEANTRTFWLPLRSRFGYFSYTHPALEASFELGNTDIASVSAWLALSDTPVKLARQRVKYVIVPYDSEKEIFASDRRYDALVENAYHALLTSVPWLTKVSGFQRLTVMENPMIYPYVWEEISNNSSIVPLSYSLDRSTDIQVKKDSKSEGLVVLSERYDPLWAAVSSVGEIGSRPTWDNLNSFDIPVGWSSFALTYKPQFYVDIGVWISLISTSVIVFYFIRVVINKYHK